MMEKFHKRQTLVLLTSLASCQNIYQIHFIPGLALILAMSPPEWLAQPNCSTIFGVILSISLLVWIRQVCCCLHLQYIRINKQTFFLSFLGVQGHIQVPERCMYVLSEWYTFGMRGSSFVKEKDLMKYLPSFLWQKWSLTSQRCTIRSGCACTFQVLGYNPANVEKLKRYDKNK